MLTGVPTISLTDAVSWIVYVIWNWTGGLVFVMLWVIIITRLHAMYQRSRKILIFLIVTFLAINTFGGVSNVIATMHKEFLLSDSYQCSTDSAKDIPPLISISWILIVVWEVLTLCLAVWIAVKHFRELRQHSAGGMIRDCFMTLMKTHVVHSSSVLAVSCFQLIVNFSPKLVTDLNSLEVQTFFGLVHILEVVEMSVLGPRLILGVREYHANLMANSDAATGMTSFAFQEHVHISTGSGV
ncbi:hypothetical protein BDR06DRAFT_433440 [Suillus hirtellus]|nr:hypothetical protein BDR06DRAFT_433440 [Suillus hirtellus]